jgi:predicted N-acetyltransferase YhbS
MFSPMTVNGQSSNWHALGPVAVHPDHKGKVSVRK